MTRVKKPISVVEKHFRRVNKFNFFAWLKKNGIIGREKIILNPDE